MNKLFALPLLLGAIQILGCKSIDEVSLRSDALDAKLWAESKWISVADAAVKNSKNKRAASGTSIFISEIKNDKQVKSAKWMTSGLGVYNLWVNGKSVGAEDFLKPGFTHVKKTKRSFTYDVTPLLLEGKENVFSAEVSSGWWRDKIIGYKGRDSAF